MKRYTKNIATPVGTIRITADETAIVGLTWTTGSEGGDDSPLLRAAEAQLREYFSGRRKEFDLPLELAGTPFQRKVWRALQEIPFGKTWSYRQLAERVGSPRAVRAVGSANGKNPVSILVPCHRVIRHSGELGGYAGGLGAKRLLLDLEGA